MDIIIVTNDLHVCDLDKLGCMLNTKEKLLRTCTTVYTLVFFQYTITVKLH